MSSDLPWGLVKPLGERVPDGVDPRGLAGARPFYAYTVEENDLHFTILVDDICARRLFIAETKRAVHVVVVDEPKPPLPDGVHHGGSLVDLGPDELHGMLAQALGSRPIFDATRGEPATRLKGQPTTDELRWLVPGDHRPDGPAPERRRPLRRRKPRA